MTTPIFASTMLLTDITNEAPKSEPLIRIYPARLTLNAAACRLLKLQDDSKVSFRVGDEGPAGTKKIYISKRAYAAYSLIKSGCTYRICSKTLCTSLADLLQGTGTYRIEAESPIKDYTGELCYSIFFRRYE